MLEASLDQEVTKAVDHERVGLRDNCLHDVILLLSGSNLKLLLKEDRSLLVIIAHDLVDDVFPVAINRTVEEATIVERFSGWKIGLALRSNRLDVS